MTTALPTADQYRLVYDGICAVASHCDGARSEDGVGFNGQDTKFGRRIASVAFDQWTDEVKVEAARIALTYKVQILGYTGVDVAELDVVREARGLRTNYAARDQARTYERQAKNADKKALRKVDVCTFAGEARLGFSYAVKDPEFEEIRQAMRDLPRPERDWDGTAKHWAIAVSDAAEDIIIRWEFDVTEAAAALLQAPRAEKFDITLHSSGRLVIDTFSWDSLEDVRALPGREFNPPGFGKVNVVNAHPDVLKVAAKWGWSIEPDAQAACEKARALVEAQHAADLAAGDRAALMGHVSRLRSPEQLPPVFIDILEGLLPADVAALVITR